MELMSNQVFRLLHDKTSGAYPAGIYRVIFDEAAINKTVCVCIQLADTEKIPRGGRRKQAKTKHPRKKAPPALLGKLIWMERDYLERLQAHKLLITVEIEREPIYFTPIESPEVQEIFSQRCRAMTGFLDFGKMKESILIHEGLGGLVRDAMATGEVCRAYVYKQWSTLCRLGISEISLLPRRDRCGAKNVSRPCDPGGRKKAGRKTRTQRVAKKASGIDLPPKQPGMSTEWRAAILAADNQIKTPVKPVMSTRCTLILESSFVKKFRPENGVLVPVDPKLGEYPNDQQIRRVLEVEIPRLKRLLQKTTLGHFKRSLRGLIARNWKGVSGPGHTWAIDSTVGDIYLRSSLNRAWIVGRPIVYIIVDVWSTAIVGFYVCLTGPSWNTAKISLFNSVADPDLLGEMWGYQPILSLNPLPTMCYQLMCDRGEYLSKAASLTAIKLIPCMSYAPPYRPDLKGLVEVLHRIEKDAQFMFEPGAMDARRAEFDLRKSHPDESAMTVRDYVQYLHLIFGEYNLTADRSHRVDAHMAAAGVFPSPAGLWRWGYEMGIGVQRAIPQADLITTLLTPDTARVGRSSIVYAGNDYYCPTIQAEDWTTTARNFGSWKISIHYYPGPVGRIWTPNTNGEGLLDLKISDQAKTSAEVTFDELSDSIANVQMQHAEVAHQKTLYALQTLRKVQALRNNAIQLTQEAISKGQGATPTMTEARAVEVACTSNPRGSEAQTTEKLRDEAMEAHEEMMRAMLSAGDDEEDDHV
ncbi:MAG: transposase [Rhodoferax sp.]|uniref:transposase n=1 Tax=Rhodoferax sp. TaxID=50421 RepID=UPI0017A1E37D|nr:transposase [Rhodoferax sp.]NMM12419.1 transposase [Rhodoferax sp.]